MNIKRFNNFIEDSILEKSIGSDAIREKWYSDIDKKIFYHIVNTDPTSIRKKEFSKPGKYVKWLIKCYKDMCKNPRIYGDMNKYYLERFDNDLKNCLFIFSTGWYKSKSIKSTYYVGGSPQRTMQNDIFKFKDILDFKKTIKRYENEFKVQTQEGKYDLVYSDDKVDVLIPINFTASYEIAKNTDWCTQSYSGFTMFSKQSLLFRVLPKNKELDKVKISWGRNNNTWFIACSKYPEINGQGTPFDIVDGVERWKKVKNDSDLEYTSDRPVSVKWRENSIKIEETMNLLSDKAKDTIKEYYNKYGTNKEL